MRRIKNFKRKVLSQAALLDMRQADIAAGVGVTDGAISQLLNGKSESIRLAVKICRYIGLPHEEAFKALGLEDPDKK